MDCTASSSGVNTCTHAQDAGVRCLQGMYICNLHTISLCQLDNKLLLMQVAQWEMFALWEEEQH